MEEDLNSANSVQNDEKFNIEEVSRTEDIPDWLAKIRARETAERAQQQTEKELQKVQKKSQGSIPDWLSSIGEGIEFSTPLEESLPIGSSLEASERVPPTTGNEITPPPEAENDWLESLQSWQPVNILENLTDNLGLTNSAENEISEIRLDENDRDIDLGVLKKPDVEEDLQVDGGSDETPKGEAYEEKDVASWYKKIGEIDYPIIHGESIETPIENKIENNDTIASLTPEFEQKDQIAQVFEELQSQVVSEEIVLPDFIEDKSVSDEFEPAPPPDILVREDLINEVISTKPLLDNSSGAGSVNETHFPVQSIIEGDEIEDTDSSEPFKPDELPDWLNNEHPVAEPKLEQDLQPANIKPVMDTKAPKPEKANLPVWLEAMRPVDAVELPAIPPESTAVGKSTENLENMEALVVSGKLPQPSGKPSDLVSGLKVTERQKANASLLSIMAVDVGGSTDEESKTVLVKKHVLLRALLALVFFAFAIFGETALVGYGLQPALFPEEVVHTIDQINSLPVDKTVLIAGDFEAALAGEIRWSSQPLIQHLMRRNLAIALISTNPVDTALLSDQITKGLGAVPNYPVFEKVVDLGYLPGGAIAVQSLNGEFSMSVPLTAELTTTSTHPLLSTVDSLNDFGAVIVITDDSENARIWIEQIQPQIATIPLLMVTSAQAAPLIQPYYQSGQLAGLVSGMPGSLVYERILQTPGNATDHLSSLQMLSVLMAGLVLVGGFVSMVKPAESGEKL